MRLQVFVLMLGLLTGLLDSVQAQGFRSLVRDADEQVEQYQFFAAIELYEQALERRRNNQEVWGKVANAYRITNQMEKASGAYVQALDTRRPEPELFLQYGHVLKALQQYEEAKKWFLQYAEEDPAVGNHFAETCDYALFQRGNDNGVDIRNANINTRADAYGPTFHPQGLVFSSSRYNNFRPEPDPQADGSFRQPNELYLAIRNPEGQLTAPRPLLQNQGWQGVNIGPVDFAEDGTQVAYTRNNFAEGVRHIPESGMKLDLFLGIITPDGNWAGEQAFPYNGPGHSNGFPCFSPDGQALYFASNLGTGFGGYDIFVSYRRGDGWSPPENLGPVVNSPGNEISPYFDGAQLFFASDWHPGFGGYDLFRAEQAEDGRWNQIFHLGAPVSSSYDDMGPIYHGFSNVGFLSSNRTGGAGGLDLYQLARPAENIVIQVTHAADGSPIPGALIDFSNCGEGLRQTDEQGLYQFPAVEAMNCQLVVRKDEYVDKVIPLQSTGQPGSQQVQVRMNRRDEEYVGQVTDYTSGLPIPTATVSAVNQSTGQVTRASTDSNGNYRLGLAPNAVYLISYSAPGYREATRSLPVQPGDDPNLLGSVSLLSASASLPPGGDPAAGQMAAGPPTAEASDVLPAGYAVQVAALARPATDQFSNLQSFGRVYSIPDGGRHKIRVGVFADRSRAQEALRSIKAAGYPSAFVVPEAGGRSPEAFGGAGPVSQFASSTTPDTYRIQIGAFREVYNFKDWKVESFGTVKEQQRGNLTIKYLTGFQSLEQARSALAKVHQAGFPDAYIVENRSGSWRKIQ